MASSASDEPTTPRSASNNRSSLIIQNVPNATAPVFIPNNANATGSSNKYRNSTSGQGVLLHSYSTNDASLGEYKYTVNVGQHSIKITGDCFELVRAAKLLLDDYFSSAEFLASVDAGATFDTTGFVHMPSGMVASNLNPYAPPVMPVSHQLVTSTPMVDSGIALDRLSKSTSSTKIPRQRSENEYDDDVFIVEDNGTLISVSNSSGKKNSVNSNVAGLSRSRKTNFPSTRKSRSPEDEASATEKSVNKVKNNASEFTYSFAVLPLANFSLIIFRNNFLHHT